MTFGMAQLTLVLVEKKKSYRSRYKTYSIILESKSISPCSVVDLLKPKKIEK